MIAVCLLVLSGVLSAQGNSDNAFERVKEVKARHAEAFMAEKDVVGIGVGLNDQGYNAVVVLLETGVGRIPEQLEGVPVHRIVTGKIEALKGPTRPPSFDPTGRFRPTIPIGVSTGNIGECSAGTIGCRLNGGYALSNNHVYALENAASVGSKIVQPGRYDTGCATNDADIIGELSVAPMIHFDTTNLVDAAMAAIDSSVTLLKSTPADGYGTPKSETTDPVLGAAVQKYGRTSRLTKGQIVGVDVDVKVGYTNGVAAFRGQIMVASPRGAFIKAGDSGSLLVTDEREPVGLLFAGNTSGKYAWANDIDDVLLALGGMTIDGE